MVSGTKRKGACAVAGLVCLLLMWAVDHAWAWPVPDSGQTISYAVGDDGYYNLNPHTYTDNSDGTVTDNGTTLMWQQQDDDKARSWADANSYCEAQTLAGYTDWRLPTVQELSSLVDRSKSNPAVVDKTIFPGTNSDSWYWSSTINTNSSPSISAFHVKFNDGDVDSGYKTGGEYVRCVRSGPVQDVSKFVLNNGATATDANTGLSWQRNVDGQTKGWKQSISYCEELTLDGFSDWRMPTINELLSITDYSYSNPSANSIVFPDTNLPYGYWSSTVRASQTSYAWYVWFGYGSVGSSNLPLGHVRCVRSGPMNLLLGALAISSPSQGATVKDGTIHITWVDSQNIGGQVAIFLSRKGGKDGSWETITGSTDNDGVYDWVVTGSESVNCVLKVEPIGGSDKVGYKGLFAIKLDEAITLTAFDKPEASNTSISDIDGINIVGNYVDNLGWHAFLYNESAWTTLSKDGASQTTISGIDGNNIVGNYFENGVEHGFLYNNGTWVTIDKPGAGGTGVYDIDGSNIVGAYYSSSDTEHGFLYNGTLWTTIDAPGAKKTVVTGIDGDSLVGNYYSDATGWQGFLYNNGTWVTIDKPGAAEFNVWGIEGNHIVGDYDQHGFVYDGATWTTIDVPAAKSTQVLGVNGIHIWGKYMDTSDQLHGFISSFPGQATNSTTTTSSTIPTTSTSTTITVAATTTSITTTSSTTGNTNTTTTIPVADQPNSTIRIYPADGVTQDYYSMSDTVKLKTNYRDPEGFDADATALANWTTTNNLIADVGNGVTKGGAVTFKGNGEVRIFAFLNGLMNYMDFKVGSAEITKHYGNLIILAGGKSNDVNDSLTNAIQYLCNRIYQVFKVRMFKDEDIYYINNKTGQDFNGDGIEDGIVDQTDKSTQALHQAIQWAASQVNDGPLYLYLMDHGAKNGTFQIDNNQVLYAAQLKAWLDEFETTTNGRTSVVVLEACYSGSFVEALAGPHRMIITSSSQDNFSFFNNNGTVSFGQFFSNRLMTGETWEGAFDKAVADMSNIGGPYAVMNPQKSIGSEVTMGRVYGEFTMGSLFPEIKSYTQGASVAANAGQSFYIQLGVMDAAGMEVWAIVTPPNYQPPTVSEEFVTPALNLDTITFTSQDGTPDYIGSYSFTSNGGYTVTYYVKDTNGMVVSSPPQTFTVSGGAEVTTTTTASITTTTEAAPTTTTTIPNGTSTTFPLTAAKGWSLLSSTIGFQTATIFSDKDTFTSVWKWVDNDQGVKNWAVYLTGADSVAYANSKGFITLTEIKSGEGFWVNSTVAKQVEIKGEPAYGDLILAKGCWNLVGLKGTKQMPVTDLVAVTSAWKWANGNWAVYLPDGDGGATYAVSKGFSQLTVINPGEGFWVNVPAPTATTTTLAPTTTTMAPSTTTTTLPPSTTTTSTSTTTTTKIPSTTTTTTLLSKQTVMWKDREWQKSGSQTQMNWAAANAYCTNLTEGGYDDWYLPSIDTLKSLIVLGSSPTIDSAFSSFASYYWSSTTNVYYSAWYVRFDNGDVVSFGKTYGGYVRCVRGGQ